MTTYTVQLEASDTTGTIWQALHPSETVEVDGTATAAAEELWRNENMTDAADDIVQHRVLVWEGDDNTEKPTLIWHPES